MSYSLALLIVFAASFIGSLQVGPVNGLVIRMALEGNKRKVREAIIGGVIPELIYGTFALVSVLYLPFIKHNLHTVKYISIFFLFALGIWLIFHKKMQIYILGVHIFRLVRFYRVHYEVS